MVVWKVGKNVRFLKIYVLNILVLRSILSVIRKLIDNYVEYKKSRRCKSGLCPAKRL